MLASHLPKLSLVSYNTLPLQRQDIQVQTGYTGPRATNSPANPTKPITGCFRFCVRYMFLRRVRFNTILVLAARKNTTFKGRKRTVLTHFTKAGSICAASMCPNARTNAMINSVYSSTAYEVFGARVGRTPQPSTCLIIMWHVYVGFVLQFRENFALTRVMRSCLTAKHVLSSTSYVRY